MKYLYSNLFALLSRLRGRKVTDTFSDFLLNAPPEKQLEVFGEAARKANQDQREIVERYNAMQAKNAN